MNKQEKALDTLKGLELTIGTANVLKEPLQLAISALEKQIPKRPHHMYRVLGEYELFGECPHCGHSGLRQGVHQCCWWCGQKLDWRNEDE